MSGSDSKTGFIQRYGVWLKWALALTILGGLIYRNRETLGQFSLEQVRWGFAALGFLGIVSATLSTFVRWYLLVWAQEFDLPLNDALRLGFLGVAFSYVLPGAVSGDVVKAAVLAKRQKSRRAVAFSTVILDRALGLFALFVVGSLVWLLQSEDMRHPVFQTFALVFSIGSATGLIGLVLALHSSLFQAKWLLRCTRWKFVGGFLKEMLQAFALYRTKKRVVWATVLISLFGHACMLSGFYFCALAMNSADVVPGYFAHLLFMPVAELAGMIPIVPGGVGLLEAATAKFYGLAGYPQGNGFLTGSGFRVLSITMAALGAGYGFSARRKFHDALEESTEPDDDVAQPTGTPVRSRPIEMTATRFSIRVTKDHLVFSAGHFITFAGNTCERLHGHNWRVASAVHGPLDENHYVFDFIALRDALQAIVDELDHRMLLPTKHPTIQVSESEDGREVTATFEDRRWVFPREDCVLLPVANTTAELIADWIADRLIATIPAGDRERLDSVQVEVEENFGQWAICEKPLESDSVREKMS